MHPGNALDRIPLWNALDESPGSSEVPNRTFYHSSGIIRINGSNEVTALISPYIRL